MENEEILEFEVSDKVTAYLGFNDAHVEIKAKVPIIGKVKLRIEGNELDKVGEIFRKALLIREKIQNVVEQGRRNRGEPDPRKGD